MKSLRGKGCFDGVGPSGGVDDVLHAVDKIGTLVGNVRNGVGEVVDRCVGTKGVGPKVDESGWCG